ncbi:MAG: hypothetical protein CMJ83_05050 [Planctomycetes bacterium]|nr:hypothetical protein [Planctomycetota bacterium]
MTSWYLDSADGVDVDTGGSQAQPWRTLAMAASAVAEGDVIHLKRGRTWNESFVVPVDRLTLGAYGSGAAPVVDGGGAAITIVAPGRDGTVLRDLDVRNSGPAFDCVSIDGGSAKVERCITDGGRMGLHANGDATVVGVDCVCRNQANDGWDSSDHARLTIRRTTFTNIAPDAPSNSVHGDAVSAHGQSSITCHECTFTHFRRLASINDTSTSFHRCDITWDLDRVPHPYLNAMATTDFPVATGTRMLFESCVIRMLGSTPGVLLLPSNGGTIIARNCTLYSDNDNPGTGVNASALAAPFTGTAPGTLQLENCILGLGPGVSPGHYHVFRAGSYVRGRHNAFNRNDTNRFFAGSDVPFAQWAEAHEINALDVLDLGFVADAPMSAADFALLGSSPCRDAGDPTIAPPDFTGAARDGAPDIGAYEHLADALDAAGREH